MEQLFDKKEKGLEDRGVDESRDAVSTAPFKPPAKEPEQPTIKLCYQPVARNVLWSYHSYTEELSPYLNRDLMTRLYWYHGNHTFYLSRMTYDHGIAVDQRVTFEKNYRYRQYRRLWMVKGSALIPELGPGFILDIDPFDAMPNEIELELGAWVDPFGNKPFAPPDQWEQITEYEEWLLEIIGYPSFGRLHLRALIEQKKNAFRIRHFPAIEIKTVKQWNMLLNESTTPFGYQVNDYLREFDTGWVKVPPDGAE